ncbi:MAG: type II toxin-antitoxin system PemK/MazF family toxin [Burkholderiales bacterium]
MPKAGDIVQCRFPQGASNKPGPKDRPGLVIEVEEDPEDARGCIVRIAYGTSQDTEQRYPGEITIRATDPKAGLSKDTKFDLGNTIRLPFNSQWFATAPSRPFGDHPKRGVLNLQDLNLKRMLQAAIAEAKEARRL